MGAIQRGYYTEYNANVKWIVYQDEIVGCGCFKKTRESTVELNGCLLHECPQIWFCYNDNCTELEQWAKELNYNDCRFRNIIQAN
jgi:hypothetical protein